MRTISEFLASSGDKTVVHFTEEKSIKEFLIEWGVPNAFPPQVDDTKAHVQLVTCLKHPTHYMYAVHYYGRGENGYMAFFHPKSTQTFEHFMKFCESTLKVMEDQVLKPRFNQDYEIEKNLADSPT